MKAHIGPKGPGRCLAEKGNCPYGGEDNHFSTIVEARAEHESRLVAAYGTVESVKASKAKMSAQEKELRARNTELVKQVIALRAEVGDGIVFEDANPERALRRLSEAVAYANGRENEYLEEKLAKANVLPSGAFKTADGTRVNTDAVLKAKTLINHIAEDQGQGDCGSY